MNNEPMSVAELDIMKEVRRLIRNPNCPTTQEGCLPLAAATYAILGSVDEKEDLPWSAAMGAEAPQEMVWPWLTRQPDHLSERRDRLVLAAAYLVLEMNAIDAKRVAAMASNDDSEKFPRKYRNKAI